ncbi:MAG TPA: RagB/SusD family nutrient uptake outer membrane protein [Puia sp.]|nr:RagB/SusD family nutrient uptake outer membrane protein [Puia sp.]
MHSLHIQKIKAITIFTAVLTLASSCKKFLTPDPEKSAIQASQAFSTDGAATSAVFGIYSTMMYGGLGNNPYNGSFGVSFGLASDELNEYNQTYPDWQQDQVTYASYGPNYSYWADQYNYIYQCNAAIEGMKASTGMSDSIRTQLLGECYFVRAFCYFSLTNMYGAVPLATSSNYQANATLGRADSAAVYQQIIADLQQAESLLTPNYPSANMVRPNGYAAQALLARVYLYQDSWAKAESEVDSVLAGPYQLAANLNKVFTINSPEVIWELYPSGQGSQNAYDFSYYTPASTQSGPKYYLTSTLVNSFEPGDQRATTWMTAYPFNGTTYYYPSKYVTPSASPAAQYNVVLRLAEQYLIRAEARAGQNNLSGAAADLNAIRTRAGLAATTATGQSALLAAIAHERQVELFTEWGHRWFDLKRTGTIDAVLGAEKPTWTPDASLLPIPRLEIQADVNLSQNPGYN